MLRLIAHVWSVLLHPLLMLTYGLLLILAYDPYAFGVTSPLEELPLIVITLLYTFFLPLITTMFMVLTGLISSAFLHSREERLGPLIGSIIFYTWFYLNMSENPDVADSFRVMILGSLLALGLSFFATVFTKVSLHMVGMGALLTMSVILWYRFDYTFLDTGWLEMHAFGVIICLLVLTGVLANSVWRRRGHRLGNG